MPGAKSIALIIVSHVAAVAAQTTSLYILGLQAPPNKPITANILGVGADEQTTWLIQPAATPDPNDADELQGPATLIAGVSSAVLIYDLPAGERAVGKCTIEGTIANCQMVISKGSLALTQTSQGTVSSIAVLGGGPYSDSSVPCTTTAGLSTMTSSPIGAYLTSLDSIPRATVQPSTTSSGNGAGRTSIAFVSLAAVIVGTIAALF